MNIDQLVYTANFGDQKERSQAQSEIWDLAQTQGAIPCSIFDLYQARAAEKTPLDFTVPAFNFRGLVYHCAQVAFNSAKERGIGLFIFEIARSEMDYTDQNPGIYMANILGAAIKTNWQKPVFLQGDHFQSKPSAKGRSALGRKENQIDNQDLEKIKKLIKQSILAGFFNIDLDGSLLIKESDQVNNAKYTAVLSDFIRENQADNINISLGAEINPIGSMTNSTPEDLDNFMSQYQSFLQNKPGISKVAVQTGTSHGGVVNPDGSIKKAQVSIDSIKAVGKHARNKYHLGGVVQHGASTLTKEMFPQLSQAETLEVHLSTGFQNLIFDHPQFPQELTDKIHTWILENLQNERKKTETEKQFLYKLRKKAWKPFKKEIWQLSPDIINPIMADMRQRFDFYFQALNVINTQKLVKQYIKPIKVSRKLADFVFINSETNNSPKGLDD